jgi:chromosome segregation ATPase
MDTGGETDQFRVLEEKVEKLIELISQLRQEKESLAEETKIQEERLVDLNRQVESLKAARDSAKQRIISLLERLEQLGV